MVSTPLGSVKFLRRCDLRRGGSALSWVEKSGFDVGIRGIATKHESTKTHEEIPGGALAGGLRPSGGSAKRLGGAFPGPRGGPASDQNSSCFLCAFVSWWFVPKAASNPSTISGVWLAVRLRRRSDSPGGTEGGRIAGTQKPAFRRRWLRATASAAGPTAIGMIWLLESPVRQPAAWSRLRSVAAAASNCVRRCGSSATTWRATRAAAAVDAG